MSLTYQKKLFLNILTKPKDTLAIILTNHLDRHFSPLFILAGIINAIDRASLGNAGDHLSTESVLMNAVLVGGIFGWVAYYLYAYLMSIVGLWLGGPAKNKEFRTVLAWSFAPYIFGVLLFFIKLLIYGGDIFKSSLDFDNIASYLGYRFFTLLDIVLGIWSLIILFKGLSLIQNFKTVKTILNMFIPFLFITVTLFIIFVLPYYIRDVINE